MVSAFDRVRNPQKILVGGTALVLQIHSSSFVNLRPRLPPDNLKDLGDTSDFSEQKCVQSGPGDSVDAD